ncbi:MAG TPA: sugar-binding protein [Prolixibacteraceae bacterium]|jgi:hypothetical protein
MKKIFTFLVGLFLVTLGMAQVPTGVFAKATKAPVIDGVVDDVWAKATVYNINTPSTGQTPTLGEPGQTTWQGLWYTDGIYILLKVTDNAFYPHYAVTPAGASYEYDKPEIYFDVNPVLVDGGGPLPNGTGNGNGHYQFAPAFTDGKNDGTLLTENQMNYAFKVTGTNYVAEYFVPFTKLLDKDGAQFDQLNTIGFDITIIDRDPGDASANSAVWSNTGSSWSSMDNSGQVTLEDAELGIPVDNITITTTNGTITDNKGTFQLAATVVPESATNKVLKWSIVGGTAEAKINSVTGILTAVSNGTVIVRADATDGYFAQSQEVTVNVTGQVRVKYSDEVWNTNNLVKNWNFDTDLSNWGGWISGALVGAVAPVSVNGVCVMKTAKSPNFWLYQHNQIDLGAEANVPYTLMFKSWSTATAVCHVDFEDTEANDNARYGTSTDPEAINGSEWVYTVTTTPKWYTYHVVFNKMVASTVQKLQWMLSLSDETISLDSVLLVKTEELATSAIVNHLSNSIKVYPNPVGADNQLTVSTGFGNAKVAIYNSLGQKMMEKESTGNVAKFNVYSLRKGIYIVKLSDGRTQKFVK